MANTGERLLAPARKIVAGYELKISQLACEILLAHLKDLVRMVGAAICAKEVSRG